MNGTSRNSRVSAVESDPEQGPTDIITPGGIPLTAYVAKVAVLSSLTTVLQ